MNEENKKLKLLNTIDLIDDKYINEVAAEYGDLDPYGNYKPGFRAKARSFMKFAACAACILILAGLMTSVPFLIGRAMRPTPGASVGETSEMYMNEETSAEEETKSTMFDVEYPEVIEGPLSYTWELPAELASELSKDMQPTDTYLSGMTAGSCLFLDIGDSKYRYKRGMNFTGELTIGEALLMVVNDDAGYVAEKASEKIVIYRIEESPDLSRIFVIRADKYSTIGYIYSYAPPKGLPEGALEEIKNSSCFVTGSAGDFNKELWDNFYKSVSKGKPASIKIASYLELDPDRTGEELYAATSCDYPQVYYKTISYDGNVFTAQFEDEPTQIYEYIMRYEAKRPAGDFVFYYLTHSKSVTLSQIEHQFLSSTTIPEEELVAAFLVYSEH